MVPCTWKWKPLCSLPARLIGSCHLFPSSLKLICPRARSALVLGGPCTNLSVPLTSTTPGKAFSSSCLHWMPLIPGMLCRGDQDGPRCRQWCRVPLQQGNAEWFTQPAEQPKVLSTSHIAMEVVREDPVEKTAKGTHKVMVGITSWSWGAMWWKKRCTRKSCYSLNSFHHLHVGC